MERRNKVSVVFILDRSGSMDQVRRATISGFNEYVQTLKADRASEYRMSLTLFNTGSERRFSAMPISEVPKLSEDTYRPDGSTALYDAACETLADHESEDCDKMLVVVMTDGEENASKVYNESHFRAMVKVLRGTGRASFVFLGANQDSWANAQKWGFQRQNVATYNSTDVGTQRAFSMSAQNTVNFAAQSTANTENFFSAKDQADLGGAK